MKATIFKGICFGGAATLLSTAKTDANGVYSLAYAPSATGTNLEVRAVAANGSETVVSSIIYNATTRTVLNLVAPASAQPLAPEFQRLSADMEKVIGGTAIQNLSKAQESATQSFEFANKVGVATTLFYDPLERIAATLDPDHSWEKIVFDPWRQGTWDRNDTVLFDPTADPDVGDLFI